MKGHVAIRAEKPIQNLGGGVCRRVLSYSEELMTVEVVFEAGAEGALHTHPHTQCTYVLSGRFQYTVEDESVDLGPGDSIVVPPNLPHGTKCLEAGTLLDIFTPMRKDFIGE
ncbi:MAG: cupin domain-containing protein [Clostridia bacterium]|nr:cupin domain-containing protein [Clostridia bacterium]